ncbi:hypothetical protein DL771_006193 [Monosporascus sp. 5C6A]|nr:hypothetical protein DL771_006193 [Monosporascus sp. 5C6A]
MFFEGACQLIEKFPSFRFRVVDLYLRHHNSLPRMDASALDDCGGGALNDSYDSVTLAGAFGDGPGTVTEELPEDSAPNDPDDKEGRADDCRI